MTLVHRKIKTSLADRGMNLRQAAQAAGLNYTTLHSGIKNQRNLPFTTVDALAKALGISVQYFSDSTPSLSVDDFKTDRNVHDKALEFLDNALQTAARKVSYSGATIGLEDFLNWWHANNGRLEAFDGLADYVDLFDAPTADAKLIAPVKIGSKSLATLHFESENPHHLTETLQGFSTQTNNQLIAAHLAALTSGEPTITHPLLDEPLRNGRRFTQKYRRVLAPIYTANGARMIANFSQEIGAPQVRVKNVD